MSNPVAVLISDIHFTVSTLDLASAALMRAQLKAVDLGVPLVICGDTLDGKAIMRAECVNALIAALSKQDAPETYILVGNHDLVNEKSKEHSLVFLAPLANVVKEPVEVRLSGLEVLLIPYQTDSQRLLNILNGENPDTIICHQGVQTAHMGHYMQDKSSLPKEAFQDFRVISGHYHKAQDIKCGRPRKGAVGLFSYVGNPYSLSFGEASDGPKGFAVLMDDGTLERIPTNLRKHVVLEWDLAKDIWVPLPNGLNKDDLLWLKVTGSRTRLDKVNKEEVGKALLGHSNFKLDKIYTDVDKVEPAKKNETEPELFDRIIDATDDSVEDKSNLKKMWRTLV